MKCLEASHESFQRLRVGRVSIRFHESRSSWVEMPSTIEGTCSLNLPTIEAFALT